MLAAVPDAAFRDRQLLSRSGSFSPRAGPSRSLTPPLAPHEAGDGEKKEDHGDPEVEPHPEELVGGVDAQQLLEGTPERVPGDVETEETRRLDREAPVEEQEDGDAEQVPERLVEEGRVERLRPRVRLRAVSGVDLEAPGEIRRLAEQLLVEVVAPAPDRLREEEARSGRVQEAVDARAGPTHDPGAGEHAARDPAPDTETAAPDREGLPPLVVHRLPARDHVVEAGPDDAPQHAPHGDAVDEIPVTAASRPADSRQPGRGEDAEQEHHAVGVEH